MSSRFLTILLICFLFSSSAWGAESVTRHAITWTFDGDYYTVGQYANGDWWVIPDDDNDVDITAITPMPGSGSNGSMVNPVPAYEDGYTDQAGQYLTSLNAGLNLPLALVG